MNLIKKVLLACSLFSTLSLAADRVIINPESNADIKLKVSPAGTPVDALTITGSTGITTLGQPLPVASGGTGAVNSTTARTNLGLGAVSTFSAIGSSEITNDSIMDADINSAAAITATKVQAASASTGGVLTNGAQTIQGIKSFQDNPEVTAYDTNGTAVGTETTIIFNNETIDRSASFDNTTGVFTAPVDGVYFLSAYIRVTCNTGPNSLLIYLLVNNSKFSNYSSTAENYSVSVNNTAHASGLFRLSATDTLRVNVLDGTSGCAIINTGGGSSYLRSKISIFRVGPL